MSGRPTVLRQHEPHRKDSLCHPPKRCKSLVAGRLDTLSPPFEKLYYTLSHSASPLPKNSRAPTSSEVLRQAKRASSRVSENQISEDPAIELFQIHFLIIFVPVGYSLFECIFELIATVSQLPSSIFPSSILLHPSSFFLLPSSI